MANEELELDVNETKGSKKIIIVIVIVFLLINGLGVGAWMYFSGGGDEKASNTEKTETSLEPLVYLTMVPEFIVNFGPKSKVRYLQVDLQIATREEASFDIVNTYRPQIRNDILILLSDVTYDALKDRAGKEALQKRLLNALNKVVAEHSKSTEGEDESKSEDANHGKSDENVDGPIENVYFISFIMQ